MKNTTVSMETGTPQKHLQWVLPQQPLGPTLSISSAFATVYQSRPSPARQQLQEPTTR